MSRFVCFLDQNIKFPESYPTSCLVGYVNVSDCLPSDVYEEKYPSGEFEKKVSEYGFVFICDNFRELVCKLPMSGEHKICKFKQGSLRPIDS